MSQPSVFELFIAAVALAAFVISAWKLASWLAGRGHVIRPLTMMDYHMTNVEKAAAEKKRTRTTDQS
jgi:hypothetical protein